MNKKESILGVLFIFVGFTYMISSSLQIYFGTIYLEWILALKFITGVGAVYYGGLLLNQSKLNKEVINNDI